MAEDMISLAYRAGMSYAVPLSMDSLRPRQEVRDMCSDGHCQRYDRCWSCPPACGSLEKAEKQIAAYSSGILVQSIGSLEDDFDIEGIETVQARHKAAFQSLVRWARQLEPGCLPLSAGSCTICKRCTWPGKPCRYPHRRLASMEAYGLLVSDICLASGLRYNYGPGKMSFTSCILFEREI